MVLAADAQLAQTRLSPFVRDAINLDFFSPLPPFTLCPRPETAVCIPPDHTLHFHILLCSLLTTRTESDYCADRRFLFIHGEIGWSAGFSVFFPPSITFVWVIDWLARDGVES